MIGPGSKLGRYRLIEPIGAGGMSAVYRAYDPTLDREVAIKILPAELALDESYRRRFQEEARALGHVEHPNLVRIYAVGQEGPASFYAMELVDGVPLKEVIEARGRLSTDEALAVFAQFLQGIEAVHRVGIIHRDVKPGNIMLDRSGRVVLMDFGLARRSERQTLTIAGSVLGTPEYMSPEQACGEKADERSDLYAAGIVLYEMLAGRPPFCGKDTIAILREHVESPVPPIRDFAPALPDVLARVIEKLLEKKPSERYPLVSTLATELMKIAPDGRRQKRIVQDIVASQIGITSRPTRALAPAVGAQHAVPVLGDIGASDDVPLQRNGTVSSFQPTMSHDARRPRDAGKWWTWITVTAAAMAVLALLVALAALVRGREELRQSPSPPVGVPAPAPVGPWRVMLRPPGEARTGKFLRMRIGLDGRMLMVLEGYEEPVPFMDIQKMEKGGETP